MRKNLFDAARFDPATRATLCYVIALSRRKQGNLLKARVYLQDADCLLRDALRTTRSSSPML